MFRYFCLPSERGAQRGSGISSRMISEHSFHLMCGDGEAEYEARQGSPGTIMFADDTAVCSESKGAGEGMDRKGVNKGQPQ